MWLDVELYLFFVGLLRTSFLISYVWLAFLFISLIVLGASVFIRSLIYMTYFRNIDVMIFICFFYMLYLWSPEDMSRIN